MKKVMIFCLCCFILIGGVLLVENCKNYNTDSEEIKIDNVTLYIKEISRLDFFETGYKYYLYTLSINSKDNLSQYEIEIPDLESQASIIDMSPEVRDQLRQTFSDLVQVLESNHYEYFLVSIDEKTTINHPKYCNINADKVLNAPIGMIVDL